LSLLWREAWPALTTARPETRQRQPFRRPQDGPEEVFDDVVSLSSGRKGLPGLGENCKVDDRIGQAVWVTLVAMPAILVNIAPASQAALGVKDLIGVGIWAAGFGLEIVADRRELQCQSHPYNAVGAQP